MKWKIKLHNGEVYSGDQQADASGKLIVACDLPDDRLEEVSACLHVPLPQDTMIFMNGYQTWTYCRERGETGTTRGVGSMPRPIVRHYSLDRYGDYHFTKYPEKKGRQQGVSYCYFRKKDSFYLIASLDEKPGYTLFEYDVSTQDLTVRRDCKGVRCGGLFHAFDLFVCKGSEQAVFDAWFFAMGIQARTAKKIAGYSSWYNRYQNISEETIREDLKGCGELLQQDDVFQIDDGWETFVGDWLHVDEKKFPGGMKKLVDDIHAKGLRAGLWLAPFVAEEKSEMYEKHPEWFLKHKGKKWKAGGSWSGYYAMDLDNAQFRSYLRDVFYTVLEEWGFDLVKLDFLYAVAPFPTLPEEMRDNPKLSHDEIKALKKEGFVAGYTESRAARMIRAAAFLRELCGDKLILGCGTPIQPAFGVFDYCRVSCDVTLDWDDKIYMKLINRERPSTKHAILTTLFRRQLDARAHGNDSDVLILRTENTKLTPEEKDKLATVAALFSSVFFTSDNMGTYDENQKALYKKYRAFREAVNKKVSVSSDGEITVSWQAEEKEYRLKL